MELNGQIILAYIEEDNIQRAFFRVRPLLCEKGLLSAEDISAYPDNGFLRIVPDKNEQHTFKERMRGLGSLCIIDLKNVKPDYSKVRTNKNYSPEKGEFNQFIVYSDAVKSIPANLFYEVVPEGSVSTAVTPIVFVRNGGNIQGSYFRENGGKTSEELCQVKPDSAELFALVRPDEKEHLIYWPHAENEAQLAEKKEEALPNLTAPADEWQTIPNQTEDKKVEAEQANKAESSDAYSRIQELDAQTRPEGNLLKQTEAAKEAVTISSVAPIERKNLSGTPLYQSTARSFGQNAHNRNNLSETVERQRFSGGRYEPAGAEIGNAGKLKEIKNPVSEFKIAFSEAWRIEETRNQIIDTILETPGMRDMLSAGMGASGENIVKTALKAQLQDMEAERLMQLMRLEEMKGEKERLMTEALIEASAAQKKELIDLQHQKAVYASDIDSLSAQVEKLIKRRDELASEIYDLSMEQSIASPNGMVNDIKALSRSIAENLQRTGFECNDDFALAMLAAKSVSNDIYIVADGYENSLLAANAFASALGAAVTYQTANKRILRGGTGYKLLITKKKDEWNYGQIIIGSPEAIDCPVFYLAVDRKKIPCEPVSYAAADEIAVLEKMKESLTYSAEADTLLLNLREALPAEFPAVNIYQARQFIAITQNTMRNGIASAMDYAVMLYVLPYLKKNHISADCIAKLTDGMICTMEMLKR